MNQFWQGNFYSSLFFFFKSLFFKKMLIFQLYWFKCYFLNFKDLQSLPREKNDARKLLQNNYTFTLRG